MKRHQLKVLGLLILALILWRFCGNVAVFEEQREQALRDPATRYLLNRPWVDRVPEDPRSFAHLLFLSSQKNFGVTVHGSQYRHIVNVVRHEQKDGTLRVSFLQDNLGLRVKYQVSECRDAPKGLDLCLVLDFRAKKLTLYSSTKWSRSNLPDELEFVGSAVERVDEISASDAEQVAASSGGEVEERLGEVDWFESLATNECH